MRARRAHEGACFTRRVQGTKNASAGRRQGQEAKEVMTMALTRDFKRTVVARVERYPAFARALLDEAATLFLSGEPETARLTLRDLVNATLGFEQLAKLTAMPSKSLHRMLSPKGNPSMDNLAAIFNSVRKRLKVSLKAHTVNMQKVAQRLWCSLRSSWRECVRRWTPSCSSVDLRHTSGRSWILDSAFRGKALRFSRSDRAGADLPTRSTNRR